MGASVTYSLVGQKCLLLIYFTPRTSAQAFGVAKLLRWFPNRKPARLGPQCLPDPCSHPRETDGKAECRWTGWRATGTDGDGDASLAGLCALAPGPAGGPPLPPTGAPGDWSSGVGCRGLSLPVHSAWVFAHMTHATSQTSQSPVCHFLCVVFPGVLELTEHSVDWGGPRWDQCEGTCVKPQGTQLKPGPVWVPERPAQVGAGACTEQGGACGRFCSHSMLL